MRTLESFFHKRWLLLLTSLVLSEPTMLFSILAVVLEILLRSLRFRQQLRGA
ncbi:hypothetical protein PR003_g23082 [Phytophthora rubi]|uniref:Uncharacterized protein n=1 Tax=Phytophthora rubi TaxID=129364 RepID=A0A6A3J2G3_9STRA|nr:hypothetical protein PR002_g21683 [Phytophthora rubi]KAE9015514.1 hypothetical protein PR001_g14885 [Phytophthora rubi]KAE9299110.1 hypothetical protein PR003_g23082 [Phytophthora rubi]